MENKVLEALKVLESLDPEGNEYKNATASLLRQIDPQKAYGPTLYDSLARLTWSLAFEAVALRRKNDKVEIYLRQRAADDTAYPGEWHAPGSVRRPGESWRKVADRLTNEFGTSINSFREVGRVDSDEARGSFESAIFLVWLAGHPRVDGRHGRRSGRSRC